MTAAQWHRVARILSGYMKVSAVDNEPEIYHIAAEELHMIDPDFYKRTSAEIREAAERGYL